MSNIAELQTRILGDIRAGTCPSLDANNITYIEYGCRAPDVLRQMFEAKVLDHAIIYTPNDEIVAQIEKLGNPAIHASKDPKDFFGLKPQMVRIDAHMNDHKQTDAESTILSTMEKTLTDCRPFMFVRNDDPVQSDSIIHYLQKFGYQTLFACDNNDGTPFAIWIVAIPKHIPVDKNLLTDKVKHPIPLPYDRAHNNLNTIILQ